MRTTFTLLWLVVAVAAVQAPTLAQEEEAAQPPVRGSIVEDRAARKLLEAGDARMDANETAKAVEIWQSVIERYPRSRVRYAAHMRLGNYFLEREAAHDRARGHFEAVAVEENRDDETRAEATLKMGICFYEARNYGKCFKVMREVIEKFPVSKHVNQAYYYIGLGHFQLQHYSRAIAALEKVGTAFVGDDETAEKLEAGKRLFVKVEDADLAVLEADERVQVRCETTQGDAETVECFPVGRNVRVVLGSIMSSLGKPRPDNGVLEVRGDDTIKVRYLDAQTADRKVDQPVLNEISVVGNGRVEITDGAFADTLQGVVLDRGVNVQITDPDRDKSDEADSLQAVVGVYREKTDEEIEAEIAELTGQTPGEGETTPTLEDGELPEIDKFKLVDQVEVTLTEAKVAPSLERVTSPLGDLGPEDLKEQDSPDEQDTPDSSEPKSDAPESPEPESPDSEKAPAPEETDAEKAVDAEKEAAPEKTNEPKSEPTAPPEEEDDDSVHSGVFRVVVGLVKSEEADEKDDTLQAVPGDQVRVTYLDERNMTDGTRNVVASAQTIEGNLGGVRVTQAKISDQELRINTQLKTASALTAIGDRYKEFGLKQNAMSKYEQAREVCDNVYQEARRLGGRLLEETYVQLWRIYFAMDRLELAAAMAQRLQREFPNSGFVDDALLQLAEVARKQGDLRRAIGLYGRLVNMKDSQLRGEAQFGVAECYEEMADQTEGAGAAQLNDRAFQEYKKLFDEFPESGRVGEAVAKMANYYYEREDYSRAIDTFETVLSDHPDAKFLDVILFNYGRCLYRMGRRGEAQRQFNQLIAEFPESPLAENAKQIVEVLAGQGAGAAGE